MTETDGKRLEFYPNATIDVERPEEENVAAMVQEAAAGVMVQITAGSLQGSGVILSLDEEMMVIITAAHVVQGENTAWVRLTDDFIIECQDITVSEYSDAACLRLASSLIPDESLKQCRYAALNRRETSSGAAYGTLEAGDGIVVVGSTDGVAADAYEGEVLEPWIYMEDFRQYMMLARTYAEPGMSGGGVFDQKGYLAGILCGGGEENKIAVLPITIILSEFMSSPTE